jgi:hypothetical protein
MSDETEWPEGWRWYRNEGGPYLVHPHDCELTIPQIARMLKFHGLHIVTEAEKRVLDASWAIPDGTLDLALREVGADNWVSLPSSILDHLQAEKSRRTP